MVARCRGRDVAEPGGDGTLVRVLACGLCGSDVAKLVARSRDPSSVTRSSRGGRPARRARPPPPLRRVRSLPRRARVDLRRFRAATIGPGGFAEFVRATETLGALPDRVADATATYAEPLACVLRAAESLPCGRVLIVGNGFVGRLFGAVLRRRGDHVFAVDADARRDALRPGRTCRRRRPQRAREAAPRQRRRSTPAGTLLVFAPSAPLGLDAVYRRELTVLGSRSATPRHMREAISLLPELDLPEPTVLPLERFHEGLELYRSGEALKIVFTP